MRVFITWSGERSRAVGEAIRKWLPGVLQAVKPYFSPDDVAKGSRWYPEIAKELDESSVGLLCLTRDNLSAPWLLFEAGALGKNLDKSKVCPLLFGVEPTDLTGPLSQFQGARFKKTEFKKVVKMINSEIPDGALEGDVLDSVFDMWWPKLEDQVAKSLEDAGDREEGEARSDRDILEEVLELNRAIARDGRLGMREFSPRALEDLIETYTGLLRAGSGVALPAEMLALLEHLRRPIEHMAMTVHRRRPRKHIGAAEIDELILGLRATNPNVEEEEIDG